VIFSPRADYRHHLRLSYGLVDGPAMEQAVRKIAAIARRLV
jgi:hypothetical protein